jgi:hypothetical protein
MATNLSPVTDVLHSENHSKLSSEEIAKALAGCGKTPFFGQIRNLYYAESKTD